MAVSEQGSNRLGGMSFGAGEARGHVFDGLDAFGEGFGWGEAVLPRQLQADRPGHRAYLILKRTFDVVASIVLITVLVPLLLLIALAICLDSSGPAIFRQRRVGQFGKPFVIWKFRTMVADPQRKGAAAGPDGGSNGAHKFRHDPRVTRVGQVLRRTSLDELPQLWNVLVGEMSLVGPRPELPEIVAGYQPWQHARHLVKPGITGWWQVNRDGERLMHETTELDVYYVERQAFWLDLEILLRTIEVVVRGRGAY
jgi:exopolysaccharide biosynthesis polyprenyl glycosylphosphotransferase